MDRRAFFAALCAAPVAAVAAMQPKMLRASVATLDLSGAINAFPPTLDVARIKAVHVYQDDLYRNDYVDIDSMSGA